MCPVSEPDALIGRGSHIRASEEFTAVHPDGYPTITPVAAPTVSFVNANPDNVVDNPAREIPIRQIIPISFAVLKVIVIRGVYLYTVSQSRRPISRWIEQLNEHIAVRSGPTAGGCVELDADTGDHFVWL